MMSINQPYNAQLDYTKQCTFFCLVTQEINEEIEYFKIEISNMKEYNAKINEIEHFLQISINFIAKYFMTQLIVVKEFMWLCILQIFFATYSFFYSSVQFILIVW